MTTPPTKAQLAILRHMLGIDQPAERTPRPHRDYYCANAGDPELRAMAEAGLVHRYRTDANYDWYQTTPAGRAAGLASHARIRWPKARRVYSKFLDVRDALPDVTFRDFLTHPDFRETRRNA